MPGVGIWRTKSVEQSIADTDEPDTRLRKELTAKDLTVFGVAVVIGAGIFTLTARTAGNVAGPSISIAFVLAAVACGLAALCYAEFASTVPVAGSAYTFSYATFGEFVAWIIGWDLILEFALAAAVVAKGWSLYLGNVLGFGGRRQLTSVRSKFDWGALIIVGVITIVLAIGTKVSSRVVSPSSPPSRSRSCCSSSPSARSTSRRRTTRRSSRPPRARERRQGVHQTLFSFLTGADGQQLRLVRAPRRGEHRVLRVHRLRRRRHHRRGDQEPAARRSPAAFSARSRSSPCSTSRSPSCSPAW